MLNINWDLNYSNEVAFLQKVCKLKMPKIKGLQVIVLEERMYSDFFKYLNEYFENSFNLPLEFAILKAFVQFDRFSGFTNICK